MISSIRALATGIILLVCGGGLPNAMATDLGKGRLVTLVAADQGPDVEVFRSRVNRLRQATSRAVERKSNEESSVAASAIAASLYDTESITLLEADENFRRSATIILDNVTSTDSGNEVNERIFFGTKTGDFNSVVALYNSAPFDREHFVCSGVLVNDRVVLTAAHCLCQKKNPQIVDKILPIAEQNWKDRSHTNPVVGFAALPGKPDVFCPDGTDGYIGKDLALLLLEEEVSATFERARLIASENLATMETGWVLGYGLNEEGKSASYDDWMGNLFSKERRVADVSVINVSCDGRVGETDAKDHYHCYKGRELVAGDLRNFRKDACQGDSGGPLIVGAAQEYWVAAIVSRAIVADRTKQCGAGTIYTPLDALNQDWIADCSEALLSNRECTIRE